MSSIRINFRATSTFVTDGAGETYCIADTYPVTRGGFTFGWEVAPTGSRDRDNTVPVELAGINFFTNNAPNQATFRLDLPATGSYVLKAAFGDASNPQHSYGAFQDGTTEFTNSGLSAAGQVTAAGHFFDINSNDFAAASFLSSETTFTHTFSTTILRVLIGILSNGNLESSCIASLSAAQSAGTVFGFQSDMEQPYPRIVEVIGY